MAAPAGRLRVWDLPTRLFHWALAACTLTALASGHATGDAALRLHFFCGYGVLALVGFRLLWGFAGARYALFARFVRGPRAVLRYAAALLRPPAMHAPPGHNPLGALSVLALLAACGLQAATGLFATDDVASEGPLAHFAASAQVDRLTGLHDRGEVLVYALLALHLGAIIFYRALRREDLLRPMITGDRIGLTGASDEPAQDDGPLRRRAALLLLLSVALVAYVVNLD